MTDDLEYKPLKRVWEPYIPEKIVTAYDPIPIFSPISHYPIYHYEWWIALFKFVTRDAWYELYTFYHRGRYGWARQDTWSLDNYLARVFAGSLKQLADKSWGHPTDSTADAWETSLRRWSKAFEDYYDWTENARDLAYNPYDDEQRAAMKSRWEEIHNNVKTAMTEMSERYPNLWD